jgi:hypothetical protein
MKKWMKSIYSGFHDIGVIGDVLSKWSDMGILPQMNTENIVRLDRGDYSAGITGSNSVDLIIIDLDAFGVEKVKFLIFLASCFTPQTPMVLLTEQTLAEPIRQQLYTGRVLGIIEMKSSIDEPAFA